MLEQASTSTTLRQQSVDWHSSEAGDDGKPGISVPSQAPHSTQKPPSPLKSLNAPLKSLTIPATQKHTATVIFVHGFGNTGRGLIPVADILKTDPELSHVKWVLPESPRRPVTANADMVIPSWPDVYNFGFDGTEDEAGMLQTSRQLNELITAEVNTGIDASRIVLGGFSQGGAMSLLTGFTCARKLGGIAVLSGWLPFYKKIKNVPDTIVKYDHCKKCVEYLTKTCGIHGIKFEAYRIHTAIAILVE
ncbi:Phospholipase/Carboxylesterase domain containing protein [Amanita muscaria]